MRVQDLKSLARVLVSELQAYDNFITSQKKMCSSSSDAVILEKKSRLANQEFVTKRKEVLGYLRRACQSTLDPNDFVFLFAKSCKDYLILCDICHNFPANERKLRLESLIASEGEPFMEAALEYYESRGVPAYLVTLNADDATQRYSKWLQKALLNKPGLHWLLAVRLAKQHKNQQQQLLLRSILPSIYHVGRSILFVS